MNTGGQIISVDTPDNGSGMDEQHSQPANTPNLLKLLHRLLRGRYPYAIALAIVGAIVCGVIGYVYEEPVYQSIGYIEYKPVLPRVLYQSEESSVMPMFDAFIETQASLLQSQRVLNMAMQDESWRTLNRTFSADTVQEFKDNLEVTKKPRSTLVFVSFSDPVPDIARTAVKTTIDAYIRIQDETNVASNTGRLQLLEQRRTRLANERASIRTRILDIANEFGSDALDRIYQFKLTQLNELEDNLNKVDVALAAAGISTNDDESPADTPTDSEPIDLPAETIAVSDPGMRRLLETRRSTENQLELLKTRFGDSHRNVVEAMAQLKLQNEMVENYVEAYRASQLAIDGGSVDDKLTGIADVAQLLARRRSLQVLFERAKSETLDLGRKKLQIDNLRVQADTTQRRLDEVTFRIEQLNVESPIGSRIVIRSHGSQPVVPIEDKRKKMAVLAGGAGATLGFGMVALLGLIDRRLRSSQDALANAPNVRFLGMLPNLPENLGDPEYGRIAGNCVHHIRTLLQLGPVKAKRRVFAITSPAAGNGKTSLTLALGLSFATAGSRTLLVDCDFASGSLTSRLKTSLRRRIGDILMRRGLVGDEQIEYAAKVAISSGNRLGDTLIRLGLLSEENLTHALNLQGTALIGLIDALEGEDIDRCTINTGVNNLDILPIGGIDALDMSRVSPAAVHRVIQEARKQYDVVLLDTGPIPGGVEASITASQADGVVLVVSRGEQMTQVKSTLASLDTLGTHVEGLVFNRADRRDIAQSPSVNSYMARPTDPPHSGDGEPGQMTHTQLRSEKLGPVARAVASTVRSTEKNGEAE